MKPRPRRLLILLPAFLLAVGTSAVEGKHPEEQFGKELPIVRSLGVGGSMDATVVGDTLYVISGRTLNVADISRPEAPKLVGSLGNMGRLRQIEVSRGVAYITAREDGMYIVDVRRADAPKLLCHYDTIELATGIAISGDVAFVACRTTGVELVDISNPSRPIHLSTVRTGEAQSVVARDGILYAGVWGSRELVICDVSNPCKPTVITKTPLDGNGDGVCLRGKHCFVATGHHSRGWKRREGEASPHYGHGHGLEIFDVSDPAKPVFVSRIKMPKFYQIGMDMWDVMVVGQYAFVSDTFNGLFVVDISDLKNPRCVGHRELDKVPVIIDGFPTGQQKPDPVAGFALAKDYIYAAGAWTDLHVVAAPQMAQTPVAEPDRAQEVPAKCVPEPDPRFRVYRPSGQVCGVAFLGDTALVAAGSAGLHAVQLWPNIKKLAEYETENFARDVAVFGDLVFVAECKGGLSIWKRKGEGEASLERIGRYRVGSQPIQQVVVPPPGKYALLHVGSNRLHIVDITDPTKPALVLEDRRLGLLYGYQITEGLLEGRYASCFWHVTGFYWYDLAGDPKPVYSGDNFGHRIGTRNGMAVLDDKTALITYRGKYALLDRAERRPPNELTTYGIKGYYLNGKPTIDGTTLYVSDRFSGDVFMIDISQIDRPKLIDHLKLAEHPTLVKIHKGIPIIPSGYQGLIVWDKAGRGK